MRVFLPLLVLPVLCATSACVGFSPLEPAGMKQSWQTVTIGGAATYDCIGHPPVRGMPIRLVEANGNVLGEDVTGVDGSFVLRSDPLADRDYELYMEMDGAKPLKLPPANTFYGSVGSYRATVSVPCAARTAPPQQAPAQQAAKANDPEPSRKPAEQPSPSPKVEGDRPRAGAKPLPANLVPVAGQVGKP